MRDKKKSYSSGNSYHCDEPEYYIREKQKIGDKCTKSLGKQLRNCQLEEGDRLNLADPKTDDIARCSIFGEAFCNDVQQYVSSIYYHLRD